MPAHIHAFPQCSTRTGHPCNAPYGACSHQACLNGGRFLSCEKMADGQYHCFHSEYYFGQDAVIDNRKINLDFFNASKLPIAESQKAIALVRAFQAKCGGGKFLRITREVVAAGLLKRIEDHGRIGQGQTYTCGPAAFFYSLLDDHIVNYVTFVINLYENGFAQLGHLTIRPSQGFLMDEVPQGIAAVDWIALGSLRDSENWFLEYHAGSWLEAHRGGTSPYEIERWFKKAGFTRIEAATIEGVTDRQAKIEAVSKLIAGNGLRGGKAIYENAFRPQTLYRNAVRASWLYQNGYKVCLMICSNLLDASTMETAGNADHFVVLTSPISLFNQTDVRFTVYSWGNKYYPVPDLRRRKAGAPVKLSLDHFLANYYGYVAAR